MKAESLIIYFTSGRELMQVDCDVYPTKNPDVFIVDPDNGAKFRVNRSKVDYMLMTEASDEEKTE